MISNYISIQINTIQSHLKKKHTIQPRVEDQSHLFRTNRILNTPCNTDTKIHRKRIRGEDLERIDQVDNTDRKTSSSERKRVIGRIPCLIMYNKKLPRICKIINKYWNVLQINPELWETFQGNAFVATETNKNLQEIIGDHTSKNGIHK